VLCTRCGGVKRERLDWLADNPLYTKRFAFFVGRRCRAATVKEVAEDLLLDWHTVKELDKQYMADPCGSAAATAPRPASTSSSPGSAPKNAAKFAWR